MAVEWYYRDGDADVGPLTGSELVQHVVDGAVRPETKVRKGEAGTWVPASSIAGLFDRAAQAVASASTGSTAPSSKPVAPPPAPPPLPVKASSGLTHSTFGASAGSTGHFEILDSAEDGGFKVEILAYPKLAGAKDYSTATTVYFANQAGIKLKQVRITLRNAEALAESGALHFMMGHVQIESKIGGVAGLGKAMMNKFVTKEAAFMPRYMGTGQIYLEPSLSHFLIYRLNDEELIADKGMFYCAQGSLDIGWALQKNVSSALFGGEGLFQTRIRGTGLCVLECPVPADEVLRVDLNDETLQVDGNFALMRAGRIDFSVEKSTKNLLGVITGGEGLLQTFRGTGTVWLAPTQNIYHTLKSNDIASLGSARRSSNTST